jgi:transmembrane sensor
MLEQEKNLILKYLEGKCTRNEAETAIDHLIKEEYGSREILGKIWQHDLYDAETAEEPDQQKTIDRIHHRMNIEDDQAYKKFKGNRILRIASSIAAVLFIPLMFYFLMDNFSTIGDHTISNNQYVEVFSQRGVRSKVELPDGTSVWLNNSSKLRYPVAYGKQRNVELEGEAYFDVAANPDKPFIVKAGNIDVKVLGTKFNVMSYPDDEKIEVALLTGSVELYKAINDKNNQFVANLTPGSLASFNKTSNKLSIREADVKRHIAWKEGKLSFYETPLKEVAREMERWYNCEIKIANDQLSNLHLTATFEGENLEQALKLMSLAAPTRYDIIPAKKMKDNTFTKQQVIIKYKSLTK